jgi:hypothetical protein
MRFVSLAIHQIGEHILDLFGGTCVRVLVLYQLIPVKGVCIVMVQYALAGVAGFSLRNRIVPNLWFGSIPLQYESISSFPGSLQSVWFPREYHSARVESLERKILLFCKI